MSVNAAINFRDPAFIRKAGMSALKQELGVVGAAYFIRQFGVGYGDYTAERNGWLADLTFDEVMKEVREIDSII